MFRVAAFMLQVYTATCVEEIVLLRLHQSDENNK